MNIFKKFWEVSPHGEIVPFVNHNIVVDYMLALSDADYDKLLKVAKVYREANRKAGDIMGTDEYVGVDDEDIDKIMDGDLESEFIETEPDIKEK